METERYSFSKNGINYDLSHHQKLGLFLEIEMVVDDETEIGKALQTINQELTYLKLEELNPLEYQRMMDKMYKATLRPFSEYSVNLHN